MTHDRHSEILDLWKQESEEDLDSFRWRMTLTEEEAAFVAELDEDLADMLEWDCCAAIKPGTDIDLVIRQVAGSMALSGFILTKEDEERIRQHTSRPVDVVAEVARLVEKHRVKA